MPPGGEHRRVEPSDGSVFIGMRIFRTAAVGMGYRTNPLFFNDLYRRTGLNLAREKRPAGGPSIFWRRRRTAGATGGSADRVLALGVEDVQVFQVEGEAREGAGLGLDPAPPYTADV